MICAWEDEPLPEGWQYCKGQQIGRFDFPDLFEAVGVMFGVGNMHDTFNLPDDELAAKVWPFPQDDTARVPFGSPPPPPEEWHLGGNEESFGLICDGERVCTFTPDGDPEEFNARLIEQAPRLLRALERAWRVFQNDPHGEDQNMLEAIERAWPGRIKQLKKEQKTGV